MSERGRVAQGMLKDEIRAAIDQIDRAQAERTDVAGLGDRMRAQLVALDEAPAGAGWEYLAGLGDEVAAVVVAWERTLPVREDGGAGAGGGVDSGEEAG